MEISIVGGDEEIAKEGEGIGIGKGEGKSDLFRDRVVVEIQRLPESVEKMQVVQPGVATLDGRAAGAEE